MYLEPLAQVVLLDCRLGREDRRGHRPVRNGGPVGSIAEDHAAVQALVLHHLRPQEVRQASRRRLARALKRRGRIDIRHTASYWFSSCNAFSAEVKKKGCFLGSLHVGEER